MWISFLLYGTCLSIFIWLIQHKNINILILFILFSLLLSLVSFFYFLFSNRFLGPESWYNTSPYIEIIYFALMILGMSARYITNAIEVRREKNKKLKNKKNNPKIALEFDWYEFSYPFFFSIITFGMLLKQIETEVLTISNVVISFQNGFFWQTVLKKEIK